MVVDVGHQTSLVSRSILLPSQVTQKLPAQLLSSSWCMKFSLQVQHTRPQHGFMSKQASILRGSHLCCGDAGGVASSSTLMHGRVPQQQHVCIMYTSGMHCTPQSSAPTLCSAKQHQQ
jgi:hypothetical protein